MKCSVIDIGTNTMLLLIGEYNENTKNIKTLIDIQRVPRLGKGVDAERNILPESTAKAIEIINEYKQISHERNSGKIFATATSFIRDSHNRDGFIKEVKEATGIEIEILSGESEAMYTFIGGVFDKVKGSAEPVTVIDIGGGSTEITTGIYQGNEILDDISFTGTSIDVGSVRLTEIFLKNNPPNFETIVNAELYIKDYLYQAFKAEDFVFSGKQSNFIGVAGTITTLAAIKHGLSAFDASVVDGTVLSLTEIENMLTRLVSMPLEELYGMGNFMEGRADIIIAGTLILKTFMELYKFNKITVSTKGLRYGIFLREIERLQKS